MNSLLTHKCKTSQYDVTSCISLASKNVVVEEQLEKIFIPVLSNIILSYYSSSWSWKYTESHESGNDKYFCNGCAIMNNEVACLYSVGDFMFRTNINMICNIGNSFESKIHKICCDNGYIYVFLEESISVIHYYNNMISEMHVDEPSHLSGHSTATLSRQILCVKNNTFIGTCLNDKNMIVSNSRMPREKYFVKSIDLFKNSFTSIISNSFVRPCYGCDIVSILVGDNDEFIVSIFDKFIHLSNVFIKIKYTNITYICSETKIDLLYQDSDDIIYLRSPNLLCRYNKFSKKNCIINIDKNVRKICVSDDTLCLQYYDRIDIYKS